MYFTVNQKNELLPTSAVNLGDLLVYRATDVERMKKEIVKTTVEETLTAIELDEFFAQELVDQPSLEVIWSAIKKRLLEVVK